MKQITKLIAFLLLTLLISCDNPSGETKTVNIIPKPKQMELQPGSFKLESGMGLEIQSSDIERVGSFIKNDLKSIAGLDLTTGAGKVEDAVVLSLDESISNEEGYILNVSKSGIEIKAATPAGIFYGYQSLLQMIPVGASGSIVLPCVSVKDEPRFTWRGMHLDVSRHFKTVDEVKKFIDILAMHKLNVFHWHLVDDQGWRIEIKKYPELTEVGAWREDRRGEIWSIDDEQREPYDENKPYYGGFYTQEEIKDIVAYAADRQITVVPEIEMPGHSRAALVAYPEYSCFGKETKVPPGGFVGENWDFSDPFCAGNDETFVFLQNIIDEVIKLFPSEYIHIGGDECTKRCWKKCDKCQARIKEEGLKDEFELQSYFIKRMEKYINSKGRKIIGWQEILEGGMDPSAAIMPWRGASALEICVEAAEGGHDVVMAPSSFVYFNSGWPENPNADEGLTMKKVYTWEPIPEGLDEKHHEAIIGVNACAWGEQMITMDILEYQTMPRIAALAEVGWTKSDAKNYTGFSARLEQVKAIYNQMDINYYVPQPLGMDNKTVFTETATLSFKPAPEGSEIRYTTNGDEPDKNAQLYEDEIEIVESTIIKAVVIDQYGQRSKIATGVFDKQDFREGENVESAQPGVEYQAFKGRFRGGTKVKGKPEKTGTIETIGIVNENGNKDAGLIIEGYIDIPEKAVYIFYLSSDDGSIFKIDDKLVVDNDGYHGGKDRDGNLIFKSGKIALDKGMQPFTIKYFDWGSGEMVKLFIESENMEKKEVTKDMLYH